MRLRSVEDEARADAQAERSQEQPSVELVLADRSAEVESAMHARYGGGLRRAPRRRLSGGGLADGYASGRRADLGRGTSLQG